MQKTLLIILALLPFSLLAQKKCEVDDYVGTHRRMAKTTVAAAKNVEVYADIPGFLKSLPNDKSMTTRKPPLSNNPYFLRVPEEDKNVTIKEAYIYSISRQADNDFQVIIGSDPDYRKAVFCNIEVSGLPESSKPSYSTLNNVRTKFKNKFGNICTKALLLMDNPVKISVTGSLFFDVEKKPGKSGPKKLRTTTAWEIHPVTEIIFLQ
jgi:hypothetical protein